MTFPTAQEAREMLNAWTIVNTSMSLYIQSRLEQAIDLNQNTVRVHVNELPNAPVPPEIITLGIQALQAGGYQVTEGSDGFVTITIP